MTMPDVAPAHSAKLPFWRTVGRAYAAPFANIGLLVRVAWLWMLLLVPALLVLSWFLVPMVAEYFPKIGKPSEEAPPWQLQLLWISKSLVMLPAAASIAVAWHRLLLDDERPTGATYIRLDRSVWIYAAFLFVTALSFNIVSELPRLVVAPVGTSHAEWIGTVTSLLNIPLAFVLARVSLMLPAIALGRRDIGLGDVWRATRRNTWRLSWGPIFCLLLLALPWLLIFRLPDTDRAVATVAATAVDLISIFGGVIGVGFLSFAYQHFFPRSRGRHPTGS